MVVVGNSDDAAAATTSIVDWGTVPLALCAILYSFEGVCLILPVENSLQRSHQRYFGPVFVAAMAASAIVVAPSGVTSRLAHQS